MTSYILKFIFIVIIILPCYLIIRKPWKHFEKREVFLAAFWLFILGLLSLVLEGSYETPMNMIRSAYTRIFTGEKINIVPFRTIKTFLNDSAGEIFWINIVGNIVMFLPWGFGIVLLWKKNQTIWRVIELSFLLTAFIEINQLFIDRSVDVDDLILNFIGGCIGALLYFLIRKRIPQIEDLAR